MVPFELLSFFRCIPVGSFGCFFFWWFLFLFPPFLHLSFTFDTMISVYFYVYPFFFHSFFPICMPTGHRTHCAELELDFPSLHFASLALD